MRAKELSPAVKTESTFAKVAWTLEELTQTGHGSRSTLYNAIAEGRLVAKKRGRSVVVLDEDRRRWLESMPPASIKADMRRGQRAA